MPEDPKAPSTTPPGSSPSADPAAPVRPKDRAELAGFPPDYGPEQRVMIVHPSIWRGRPFSSAALWLTPFVVTGLAKFWAFQEMTATQTGITFLVLAALCWGFFAWEWLFFSVARSLKISNKRVIERKGLLSRRSSEVLHEHIRSVSVHQTLIQRIFNLGTIEISSAAKADTEINMRDVPQPYKVKEVIDLYRDQLG